MCCAVSPGRVSYSVCIAKLHQHVLFLCSSCSGQALTSSVNMHQRLAEQWVCISTRLYTCARASSILTKLINTEQSVLDALSIDEFGQGN